MNNQQLQEAIDKTRMWLSSQASSTTTPSIKAKDDAVYFLDALQKIQLTRAGLASYSTVRLKERNT